jgi:hypothetical protein
MGKYLHSGFEGQVLVNAETGEVESAKRTLPVTRLTRTEPRNAIRRVNIRKITCFRGTSLLDFLSPLAGVFHTSPWTLPLSSREPHDYSP